MKKGSFSSTCGSVLIILLSLSFAACGGGYGSGGNGGGGGGGGGGNPPATPTGLTATAGNAQVALSWSASSGATSYNVSRGTTTGGPYTKISSPASTSYTDTGLNNGTTYYYVVSATNSYGTSANSTDVSAKPNTPSTAVNVTVDVLSNRHSISPYVYGVNFPNNPAYIQDSGTTMVRWGGNASTPYNWKNFDTNASADWYFQNRPWDSSATPAWPVDSVQWVTAVKSAGGSPIMSIGMLPWVAKDGLFNSISFSISKYGYTACKVNPYYSDDGDGTKAPCGGATTNYVTGNDPNDAYVPLLDSPNTGDPAGSVYRSEWVTALASAFGNSSSCPVPYFSNASCHFYNMDNEIDIWSGTHRDVHPAGSGYNELSNTFVSESRAVKSWDSSAVRFGPVSCCWYFYWNLPSTTDNKSSHANMDFLPWWLNDVYWQDQIAGTRSLDAFDVHAYTDVDPSQMSLANQRALALSITQDWWNPAFTTPAWFGTNSVTSNQPSDGIPFRIPRMRAMLNAIYPGTPLGLTEWNFAMAQANAGTNGAEGDFSTALADADAWGILGRERVTYSTRWTAADPANAAYNALKLYRNYDGGKSTFNPISVSATHNANPGLFSVYAATNASGNSLTVMVVNKDLSSATQTTFTFNGFNPSSVKTYTLSQSSPNSIVAASPAWSSTMTFQPYTATLLVITGTTANVPPSEWDLNPDTITVPASGSVTLSPRLVNGTTTVTLNTAVFDAFEGASACGSGSISLTNPTLAAGSPGAITVNAPASAGFCHFSVTASDGTTQGGWILVAKPAATLAKTAGDNQTGTAGTVLPVNLKVTLSGSPTGSVAGASVFFTITSATGGSLTNVQVGAETVFSEPKVIAITDGSGAAQVKLTLPATAGPVTVLAEGPYGLGHPVVTFNETAN